MYNADKIKLHNDNKFGNKTFVMFIYNFFFLSVRYILVRFSRSACSRLQR